MEALKRGKEVVDKIKDPVTGFSCLSITKKVTKEVQPDTTAQVFWLKNRRPDKWRDRIDANAPGAQSVEDDPVTKSLKETINAVTEADKDS